MKERLHSLVTDAWHLVIAVVAAGLAVGGIGALVGYLAGKRGGHEVLTVVIVVGVTGAVIVVVGVFRDPMSHETLLIGTVGTVRGVAQQAELLHEEEHGLSPAHKKQLRTDDLLYAGGVLLIGFAVLIGYACAWAGHPPANPFH